jgi:hypothetical protein
MDPHAVLLDADGHRLVQLASGQFVAVPFDPLTAAERAAAQAAAANDPPDELRCKYKSTRCLNPRAKKRNGELHNFCQMHRDRANLNQRNSELRKRSSKPGTPRSRSRRATQRHPDNQRDHDVHDPDDEHKAMSPMTPPDIHIPEPLQASDSPHPEPTYDELKETAMLLGFPDRDRD